MSVFMNFNYGDSAVLTDHYTLGKFGAEARKQTVVSTCLAKTNFKDSVYVEAVFDLEGEYMFQQVIVQDQRKVFRGA